MDKLIIQGGRRLKGTVSVSGSKNAALPIIVAATILTEQPSTLRNVPDLMDLETLCHVLKELGARLQFEKGTLSIEPIDQKTYQTPYDLVRKMRASIYVLGPLVTKLGQAKVSFPGGCAIGPRPVDLHLKGLEALGTTIEIEGGYILAKTDQLIGAEIELKGTNGSSVGATANIMMAAVLAKGITTIRDAACEPEIVDLANFLNKMGAQVFGAGTATVTIHGVKELHGTDYAIIPDRIEAGTFMIAGAITNGDIFINNAIPTHMEALTKKLSQIGVQLDWQDKGVHITTPNPLAPIDVSTDVYPGFPTDMQAQIMGLMALTPGKSMITESIFPDRFMHVSELSRMGAKILVDGNSAFIHGVKSLSGAPVMASDLRAGAVLILAGMAAKGETAISRVYHIDRGYEKIEEKLTNIGADIVRQK
ncbi:MAG: UDP-N-acetylglucosamine 1-carboxyvinyltransferase [Candidatus Poribacteria bacterium]|nr:UDP-N-acetylglucosamine 1-carboxyvinyltransferase [Candidatus Poribacteria bacterium]